MQQHLISAVVATAATLAACASSPPPATRAAQVERMQCESGATAQAEQILRSATVLAVEPIYSHVMTSNNNSEERVNGAKLTVRPPQGVSAEQMTRVLQCESARILLGKVQGEAAASDPYWLPERWVNIEVRPNNGNFDVLASADTVDDNLQVFHRANRYAEQHMTAAGAELP